MPCPPGRLRRVARLVRRRGGDAAPPPVDPHAVDPHAVGRQGGRPESDPGQTATIVVAASDPQEPFLAACLESVLAQTHADLEVVVVPHGECAKVQPIALARAETDSRVRLAPAGARGLGPARNLGARLATGEYLAFVGAADLLPADALATLVGSMAASGADFAVGRLAPRPTRRGADSPGAPRLAQRLARATVEGHPACLRDLCVGNRLFRTSFWTGRSLAFPDADGHGSDAPMVRAYLEAASFDVLPDVTYRQMRRGTGLPIGTFPDSMAELDAWTATQQEILGWMSARPAAVRDAWLLGVLETGATPYLEDVERATAAQWQRLSAGVRELLGAAGEGVLEAVPVEARVKAWLAAYAGRDTVEEYVARRWYETPHFPTEVTDGVVTARLPFLRDPLVAAPDSLYVLGGGETPLTVSLRRQRWNGGRLELEVFAFIEKVAMEADPPTLSLSLVEVGGGRRMPVPVIQHRDAAVTRLAADRYQSYEQGAFTATIDVLAMAEAAGQDGVERCVWAFELSLTSSGVARRSRIHHRDLTGSAGHFDTVALGERLACLRLDEEAGLVLELSTPPVWLRRVRLHGRVLEGSLAVAAGVQPRHVVATSAAGARVRSPVGCEGGEARFRLELPGPDRQAEGAPGAGRSGAEAAAERWRLRMVSATGRSAIAWPLDSDAAVPLCDATEPPNEPNGPNGLALRRTAQGNLEVAEAGTGPELTDLLVTADGLTLRCDWPAGAARGRAAGPMTGWSLVLEGRRAQVRGDLEPAGDGVVVARLPLRYDEWGLGEAPLPMGNYRVVLRRPGGLVAGDGDRVAVGLAAALAARCPEEHRHHDFRLRLSRSSAGEPSIALHTPFDDDELGPCAQQRLRERWASYAGPLDERLVYLQSYTGHTATDSQLAIHHELRRRRPDLVLVWGVANNSTLLPAGATPVLMHSREWYDVLARAKHLVVNDDLERWFARKPGQRVLQTFHGYPAKSMGRRFWRAKNFTPRRIQLELARTSADWDLILTPAPEMDEHYRREYSYDGPILSHGYPRDDLLVSDQADAVRAQTRARLGILEDQTAVLYAPTWRDDLATSYRSAPPARHLDIESASAALASEYVFLMRGHRFHRVRRAAAASGGRRWIDVTSYPEVNDLILASDAALLDYSSLRFDFALTGRPMLFLVPDLEQYTGAARGFLYDYRDTAPGPLLDSAEQVVDLLGDLESVAKAHREDYDRFNAKYNYLQDGRSAERVVSEFFGFLGDPPVDGFRATTT